MSVKTLRDNQESFLGDEKEEVILVCNGQELKFYANALSYLENQNVGIRAAQGGMNGFSLLTAMCITDTEGNKFTYDEIQRMKEEFVKPLFDAAVRVNSKGSETKN